MLYCGRKLDKANSRKERERGTADTLQGTPVKPKAP
jgi:hypothetical protein